MTMSSHSVIQNKCIYVLEACGPQFGCPSVAWDNYTSLSRAWRIQDFRYISPKESKRTWKPSIPHKCGIPPVMTALKDKDILQGINDQAKPGRQEAVITRTSPRTATPTPSPKMTASEVTSQFPIIEHLICGQCQAWMGAPWKQALWKALVLIPPLHPLASSCRNLRSFLGAKFT